MRTGVQQDAANGKLTSKPVIDDNKSLLDTPEGFLIAWNYFIR